MSASNEPITVVPVTGRADVRRRIFKACLLLGGLAALGVATRALPGATDLLKSAADSEAGPLIFTLAAACLCAVGLPRQIAAYAGGYVFGSLTGAALALVAQVLGCAADLFWARAIGRAWAARLLSRRLGGRIARGHEFLRAHPFTATLTLRLLPVGNNLVLNVLAGLGDVPARRFLLASAIGFGPQTLVFALVGAGTEVGRPVQLAVGTILFVVSALAGLWLLRRSRTSLA